MKQNRYFKKKIEILHIQWFKKIIKFSKTIICLIMNVILSAQINILIDEELLFQSKLKHCELYHKDCHLTQCFKCQKYRHTTWICCQNQKCSLCTTSEHNDHSYVFWNKLNKHCCMNCEEFHLTWFFKCKTRQKQIKKVWLIYLIKSCKYAKISTVSVELDKNIQKSLLQTLLN